VGTQPDILLGFINDFKKAIVGTALANIPVGHVDTWDVWPNATNKAVLDAVDWVGVDEYPYYESGKNNTIENAAALFDQAYDATVAAVGGKPVWVTETGWPTTGPDWDLAHPSVDNAKYYWDNVGCRKLFGKTPTFWYNLRDSNPANKMKFAITNQLSTQPYFNLTCPTTFDYNPSSTSSSASSTGTTTPLSSSSSTTLATTATPASTSSSRTSSAPSTSSTSGASSQGKMVTAAACAAIGLVVGVAALI
jgi:glucan endo-1,3-beta-D-glucosidase